MKDKFEMLNEVKINIDEYKEIKFDDNKEFKNKMKNKIRENNSINKKKKMAIASVGILVGSMVIVSEPSLAYIKNIGQQIEHFFQREDNTLSGYKVKLNQVVEDKGIEIELKEMMLGDGELLLSLKIDDSKLDKSYFGLDKEKDVWPDLDEPKVTIGDMVFVQTGGASTSEPGDETSRNMLLTCNLESLDTDNDGDSDITNFDLISKLDINKDYDVKVEINKVGYQIETSETEESSTQEITVSTDKPDYIKIGDINGAGANVDTGESFKTRNGEVIGNWTFETRINANKLLEDIKIYDLNEEFTIAYKDLDIDVLIEEVRVSPTKIKIKRSFKVNGEVSSNIEEPPKFLAFIVQDENGNEIEVRGGLDLSADEEFIKYSPFAEGELSRDMKSIKIIPTIEDWSKKFNMNKKFNEEAIILELK